jgi:cytochrome c peroxidase
MKMLRNKTISIAICFWAWWCCSPKCRKCKPEPEGAEAEVSVGTTPTPYTLTIPPNFPPMPIPADNPLTVEGVQLGRHLFYEKRLSGNNSHELRHMPCCRRMPSPIMATSSAWGSMALPAPATAWHCINLGWEQQLLLGRTFAIGLGGADLLEPVRDPIEMHETWPNAVAKLQADSVYPAFRERSSERHSAPRIRCSPPKPWRSSCARMISGNSKFDKWLRGEVAA